MRDLQISRSAQDKRRWELPGIGALTAQNRLASQWLAEAPGRGAWNLRTGLFVRTGMTATDTAGTQVARFKGSVVECGERRIAIHREDGRFVLTEGDRELGRLDARVWGVKHPITLTVADESLVADDPLLLLATAWSCRLLANLSYGAALASQQTAS